ncbi:MAG TPA: tetrathionate reductase family octaheme c-type cytochrome [Candidatus Krumholzibacteria bacterium]|nr:tetrathionate reductase family octaheme c-type cytochrome [Candidatus Krumholzibacteria bacterium]
MRKTMTVTALLALGALLVAALPAAAMKTIAEHQELTGPYKTGSDVTAACLQCHEDAAHDFMKTSHWTWMPEQNVVGKGVVPLGKKNTVNNFCIAVDSNWPRCTSCHAGYGWKDANFDFTNAENIDCLVCHDQTGKYKKFPTGAGDPVYEPTEWEGKIWEPVDLASVARSVGKPNRVNCGACHFSGGGGNNVKHGDMEKALLQPSRELDVHMSADGGNFQCQECHSTKNHVIAGNAMFASPGGRNHLECTSCHEADLHAKKILNWHAKSVACQTCHIPEFARSNPTKMWWDWTSAGDKNRAVNTDENGMPDYDAKKGEFKWGKNVVPSYAWYDGVSGQYLLGDKMNPDQVTRLNWPQGNRTDAQSKIYPFKVMRAVQPYDKGRKVIAVPKLFGKTGYWKTFDWNDAIKQGMETVGQEYSGEYGFAETEAWWKINHMVAPKEMALKCANCHGENGRMDWKALGYAGDPNTKRGIARFELSEEYKD